MHSSTSRLARRAGALAGGLALALSATGCGDTGSTANDSPPSVTPSSQADSGTVTVANAWIKAVDSGMTAAFGTISNDSDQDVTVVKATSDASTMVELHEVVDNGTGNMVMQPKKGGFPIPAGDTYTLEPGADHIMLMEVTRPLKPGEKVEITLQLDNGESIPVEATVKSFTGGEEKYDPSGDSMGSDMPSPSS